jgi:hypothetical protein
VKGGPDIVDGRKRDGTTSVWPKLDVGNDGHERPDQQQATHQTQ